MRTTRTAVLAGLVVLAAAAPPAAAGTVSVNATTTCEPRMGPCPVLLTFSDSAGEANALEVSRAANDELRFRDAGAPVQAGSGCRQIARDDARCPAGRVALLLGDGDDVVVLETQSGLIDGAGGDDRLTGGGQADLLYGGEGEDELHGGGGDDQLIDADTSALEGDPPETADTYDGGPGADVVSYGSRSRGISADLRRGTAGGPGERDRLVDVEGLAGGSGEDRLIGDGGDNDLSGGNGRDRISGLGGDDRLQGGLQTDKLSGGKGDDQLIGTFDSGSTPPRLKRGQDFLRCGRGKDIVERADLDDLVVSGCEGVEPEQGLFLLEHPLRPVIDPRRLTSPVIRIANAVYAGQRVVMRVREPFKGGRVLGRTAVVRDGAGQKSVRLNRRGRALLARRSSMRVGVEAFERGGDRDEIARFRLVLRRPAGR